MKKPIKMPTKDSQIVVRCTEVQKMLLEKAAKKMGAKPAAYIRWKLFDK